MKVRHAKLSAANETAEKHLTALASENAKLR